MTSDENENEDVERLRRFMTTGGGSTLTIADVDRALDAHHLWITRFPGTYYQARRNGATKRWKRDPTRFSIPVKVGSKTTHRIEDMNDFHGRYPKCVISETNPSIPKKKAKQL